jgi:transposase-like protein
VATDPSPRDHYDVSCPHCRKQFSADLIEGRAARYAGFKCPHCKLFVPLERAGEQQLAPPID